VPSRAFLGAISSPTKGAHAYLELLTRLRDRDIEWHFFGDIEANGIGKKVGALDVRGRVVRHGAYRREDIGLLLQGSDIDLCVLLSPWAETFSYTLSEALCAGVPVVVSDLGAPAERIAGTELGVVVHGMTEAAQVLTRFAADLATLSPLRAAAQAFTHTTVAENASRYADLYEALRARRRSSVDALDAAKAATGPRGAPHARRGVRAWPHDARRNTARSGSGHPSLPAELVVPLLPAHQAPHPGGPATTGSSKPRGPGDQRRRRGCGARRGLRRAARERESAARPGATAGRATFRWGTSVIERLVSPRGLRTFAVPSTTTRRYLLAILALAALLRLFMVTDKSIWIDEFQRIVWAKGYDFDRVYDVTPSELAVRLPPQATRRSGG